jgi:hypothetical protein
LFNSIDRILVVAAVPCLSKVFVKMGDRGNLQYRSELNVPLKLTWYSMLLTYSLAFPMGSEVFASSLEGVDNLGVSPHQATSLEGEGMDIEGPTDVGNPIAKPKGFLDGLYDHDSRYYNNHWHENILSITNIDGIDADQFRYLFRYHFPIWKSFSLAIGPDISYLEEKDKLPPYLDSNSGSVKEFDLRIQYLSLAIAGRLQAGIDWKRLTISPYIEYGSDLFAKSLVTIKNDDKYEDGQLEEGGKNRKFSYGSNLYFNFLSISLGIGVDFARLGGDFGSSVKANGFHIIIRRGMR